MEMGKRHNMLAYKSAEKCYSKSSKVQKALSAIAGPWIGRTQHGHSVPILQNDYKRTSSSPEVALA